jgi:hypothetical protein
MTENESNHASPQPHLVDNGHNHVAYSSGALIESDYIMAKRKGM